MDSLTHIVLGAAIGDRILGKKIGRHALWVGALAKTLPDFDILVAGTGASDPRSYILYHRSYTHSFFVELLTAFPMAWIFFMLFKRKVSYAWWLVLWLTCLWGHSLLDLCTNFGTRVLLPFSAKPFSFDNIAVADLFFTLPLLLLVLTASFFKNESRWRIRLMRTSFIYAGLYLALTFVNKIIVNAYFKESLRNEHITYSKYMSNPFILNNILWFSVVNSDSMLITAEFSLLKKDKPIVWHKYPIGKQLFDSSKSPDINTLRWFSQGFYIAQQNQDTLEVFMPKFGRFNLDKEAAHESYVFHYKLYQQDSSWQLSASQPDMKFGDAFSHLVKKVKGD